MKKILLVFLSILIANFIIAQKINGQWRGYFNSKGDIVLSSVDNTEYVLELELNGSEISGFSYSYFQNRRYYVICSLKGIYYKSTKSMKVTETARIKGLTPPDWRDCLQTHILTYQKEGDTEELGGNWVTAPGQIGDCGLGKTTLTRRTISKDLSSFNKPKSSHPFSLQKSTEKSPPIVKNNRPSSPPKVKNAIKPRIVKPGAPVVKNNSLKKYTPEIIVPDARKPTEQGITWSNKNFEKRNTNVLKTIEIDNPTFKVDLYDNGDIDGDSISLFYNGKLLLSHKRLGDKPLTLNLETGSGDELNELTMYAENLGEIPPNTALMIITDGEKRYEVRISSDLKKSGTIRFVNKPVAQASKPANTPAP